MKTFKEFNKEKGADIDVSDMIPMVIAPGRWNPPHAGHKLIIERLLKLAETERAQPVIIVVDSGNLNDNNPLTGEERVEYIKKQFPCIETVIAKDPFLAVEGLFNNNKFPVGGVTGTDRADTYKKMIGRMFGPALERQYVAEIIQRDPDSLTTTGISGTKVRESIIENDYSTFKSMVCLSDHNARQMYELLRERMETKNG